MAIPEEITLPNWKDFENSVMDKAHRQWAYRGQSNSKYELESSLYRSFRTANVIFEQCNGRQKNISRNGHEQVTLAKFISSAHLFLSHFPDDDQQLEWLALMQHYGAPTRMLDFTFSPFVAAFFALEDGIGDAAIFCVRTRALREIDKNNISDLNKAYKELLEKDQEDLIMLFEPKFANLRLAAQQGCFLVPGTNMRNHREILQNYELGTDDAIKIILPASERLKGLKRLRQMNITATTLFSGLEGLGRSMKNQSMFQLGYEKRFGE